MAIFTPTGLKIRLRTDEAFTLLARLHPNFSAFQVLKTVEGIEGIPALLAFFAGVFGFVSRSTNYEIAIYVAVSSIIGGIIIMFGSFLTLYLVRLSTLASYLQSFGILTIVVIATGFFTVGWKGILFYYLGRVSGWVINSIIDGILTKILQKKVGLPLTSSERSFYNAYRIHASRIGITTNIELEPGELESRSWEIPFNKLEREWPKVTARFT
jgi:hypothetical protein